MRRRTPSAFTLVEALVAAVVLALSVAAVTVPFTAGTRNQEVEARLTMATGLAEQLMEEILQRSFEEPDDADGIAEDGSKFGPDAGESSRAAYDAIDDFHGWVENAGQVRDSSGVLVSDPAALGLSRHASVEYVTVSGQDPAEPRLFLRVTVEVRHEGTPLITLVRLVHWTDND
jgi:type II secretory pathway pseudopilin PulG